MFVFFLVSDGSLRFSISLNITKLIGSTESSAINIRPIIKSRRQYGRYSRLSGKFKCVFLLYSTEINKFCLKHFFQNSCGAKIGICRALLNRPDVVSIGIVWDSERPAAEQVHSVLKAIGTNLRLADVFHQVSEQRWAQNIQHELVGIVSYYGKHYTTFFFHTKLKVWVYFDDANVKEVRYQNLLKFCNNN